jgi:hypothetical protein
MQVDDSMSDASLTRKASEANLSVYGGTSATTTALAALDPQKKLQDHAGNPICSTFDFVQIGCKRGTQ